MSILTKLVFQIHLEDDEKILDIFHRHPFVMFNRLIKISFFGFLLPLFFYYLFPDFYSFFVAWIAIGAIKFIYVITGWYHDTILATTVSLVKIEWHGFFHKTSSRLEYHNIQGITYTVHGVRKTIFRYGDLVVDQGGSAAFSLKDAINPSRVEERILHHQESFVSHQSLKDSDTLKELLTAMLRQHAKKQGPGNTTEKKH